MNNEKCLWLAIVLLIFGFLICIEHIGDQKERINEITERIDTIEQFEI